MAGKRDSRRHSTTSFSKNVVVAKTSYEMLDYQGHPTGNFEKKT